MKVVVLAEADDEAREAALWYDERDSGVGDRLLAEYSTILQNIEDNPERYPLLETIDPCLGVSERPSFSFSLRGDLRNPIGSRACARRESWFAKAKLLASSA